MNDVVCPSDTRCYAVGGSEDGSGPGWIIGSSDSGQTWHLLDTTPTTWFASIACPTVTRCTTVGGGGGGTGQLPSAAALATTDGGGHWADVALPPQVGSFLSIACPSITTCVAIGTLNLPEGESNGDGITRTTDGGATWAIENPPTGIAFINVVTCPSTSFCIIGGSGPGPGSSSPSMSSVSDDAGASWAAGVVAGGPTGLGEISCVSAEDCVGLIGSSATDTYGAASAIVTSDGGMTWTTPPTPVGAAVSCVDNFCLSVGGRYQPSTNTFPGDAFASTDGGQQWMPMSLATPDTLTAVACSSSRACVAVGGSQSGSSSVIMTYGH